MTIRKAIPILWKYLAVVATSCALAFVISREGRASMTASALSSTAVAKAETAYDVPGTYRVETIDQDWRDTKRDRIVPVRIDAPIFSATELQNGLRVPVIIFSHGLGGNRAGGKYWGEHWASHGYVVVHLQHPGSDESIWKGKPRKDLASNMRGAMTIANLGLRVDDVHFAIDEMIRLSRAGTGVFKYVDANKIGMSGHSFGAQTTMAALGQTSPFASGQSGLDKRITAGIAFSPNARNKNNMQKQFGDIQLPAFTITGTKDGSILDDGTKFEDRILPYRNMPAGDKYLAVYEGGDHMVFGGQTLEGRRPQTDRDMEIQKNVKVSTLVFWDAYLKNDTKAKYWLQNEFNTTLAANDKFESK